MHYSRGIDLGRPEEILAVGRTGFGLRCFLKRDGFLYRSWRGLPRARYCHRCMGLYRWFRPVGGCCQYGARGSGDFTGCGECRRVDDRRRCAGCGAEATVDQEVLGRGLDRAGRWVRSWRRCRRGNILRGSVTRRVRVRLRVRQNGGNGGNVAEGRLVRGWGAFCLHECGKLSVYFLKFSD